MLRFFRRIRQKLLNEGSLKKYLIYAIGEIALVVIGILIALQINNWNESRKLRDKELEYLQGIKSDLEQDLEFIKQSKVLYTRQIMGYSKLGVKFERYVYKDWDYPLVKIRDTTQNLSISNLLDLYGFMRSIGRVYNAISLLEQEILEAVKGIEQELE
jgi:hypothetical protein